MSRFFPVFLDLKNRSCLVVGAGEVGYPKARALLDAGARVTVVAPWVAEGMQALCDSGRVTWRRRNFEDGDVAGHFLVIAATDDEAVNARVYELAEARGRMVNVVDDLEHCNFIFGAIAETGPIQVAVSSSGTSPTLAKQLRNRIQQDLLGPETGRLADYLGRWRLDSSCADLPFSRKRDFWRIVLDSAVPELVAQHQDKLADALMAGLLEKVKEENVAVF